MENLNGKLALVTGGSRGIGFQIALKLSQAAADVIITGRNQATLESARVRIGGGCRAIVCDQSQPSSIAKMAETVLKDTAGPDILVNNAGCMRSKPVVDINLELWDEVIATNLTGVFLTTQAFLPGMIARNRGDIFMISSMSGKKGDPGSAVYNASKFGLQGFSQALNYEVRKHNIRTMVLNPSSVNTREDDGPEYGPGLYLHAADLAELVVGLALLPGRTLVRDMDIWGTNP